MYVCMYVACEKKKKKGEEEEGKKIKLVIDLIQASGICVVCSRVHICMLVSQRLGMGNIYIYIYNIYTDVSN